MYLSKFHLNYAPYLEWYRLYSEVILLELLYLAARKHESLWKGPQAAFVRPFHHIVYTSTFSRHRINICTDLALEYTNSKLFTIPSIKRCWKQQSQHFKS